MITEAISLTDKAHGFHRAIFQVFRSPIFDNSAYVISKSGQHLASRNHKKEANPLYIQDNYTLPDKFHDWFAYQNIDVLSDRIDKTVSPMITDLIGSKHQIYLYDLGDSTSADIDPHTYEIRLNEHVLDQWLDLFHDALFDDLEQHGIIENNTVLDFDDFLTYISTNTFLSVSKTNDECEQALYQAIGHYTRSLIHELVHAKQHSKQPYPEWPAYKTYMSKTPLSQLTTDEKYLEYYHASPQEIAAKAHDTVSMIINESKRKNHNGYLIQMVKEVKYIMNRRQSSGYSIVDYYKSTFPRGSKYYYVYKRFMKLVYLEVIGYIASQSNLNETATAGATSSANIGTVVNPHISPGTSRGKKSYTGSPGKSGTKAPIQPTVIQPKNSDGTAKNAQDMNASLFGGTAIKR